MSSSSLLRSPRCLSPRFPPGCARAPASAPPTCAHPLLVYLPYSYPLPSWRPAPCSWLAAAASAASSSFSSSCPSPSLVCPSRAADPNSAARCCKQLEQIARLKERQAGGDELDEHQLAKVRLLVNFHCLYLVVSLPQWLSHCRCLVVPLPSWLRHCRRRVSSLSLLAPLSPLAAGAAAHLHPLPATHLHWLLLCCCRGGRHRRRRFWHHRWVCVCWRPMTPAETLLCSAEQRGADRAGTRETARSIIRAVLLVGTCELMLVRVSVQLLPA